jgi:hypothetical protein
MRIETEEVAGFRTCGADRGEAATDCIGYQSEPITVLKETVIRTFGDRDASTHTASPDLSQFLSDSMVYVKPVDGDYRCPHCGAMCNFTLEPRPHYRRMSREHPDELIARQRGAQTTAEAAVRQAAAAERANELAAEELALRRQELAALQERANGHDAPAETPIEVSPARTAKRPQTAREDDAA